MTPSPTPDSPSKRVDWRNLLERCRKPVVVIAAVGTVLGGLAGYITMYRTVAGAPAAPALTPAQTTLAADPLSVLLLPLANLSGDPEKAYVADGLTTALTSDLGRIQDAVIVPALTAVSLAKRNLSLQQLGSEGRVRYVLQGGVAIAGDRVRLTLQLSDTGTGRQLWSQDFDSALADLITLQDELTQKVRLTMGPTLVLTAVKQEEGRPMMSGAVGLLLRARAEGLQPQSREGLLRQLGYCRAALALDESNVFAKGCIANSLRLLVTNFGEKPALSLMTEAAALAREVLLVRQDGNSLFTLGEHALLLGDVAQARQKHEQAIALLPRAPIVLNNYGYLLLRIWEPAEAEPLLLQSLELPAYRVFAGTYDNLAHSLMMQEKGAAAAQWARKAVEAAPARASFWAALALALAMDKDLVGARQAAVQALQLDPSATAILGPWSLVMPSADKEAERLRWIDEVLRPAAAVAGIPFSK